MISAHYPMTYGSAYGWAVLAVIGLAGVLVRYFMILADARKVVVALPIAAVLLLLGVAFALAPRQKAAPQPVPFARVQSIFAQRCAVCHAARPQQPGFSAAPAGVLLDRPPAIEANARRIYEQAVASHAMPPGNVTRMTPAERRLVGQWLATGAKVR
jgi:uncharacterized membrane protein